jgi:hypothetical protein
MDDVLANLDALRANPTQWRREYSRVYDGNGNLLAVFGTDELAAETVLAVNHLRRQVAALDDAMAWIGEVYWPGRDEALEALAALKRDLDALKGA